MVQSAPIRGGPDPSFPAASPDSSRVYNGTTALFPQFAVINVASSGSTPIIPAVAGLIIRVLAMDLVASAAMTIEWQTSSGAIISGPQSFAQNGGIVRPFNQAGWFQTVVGDALNINISGSGTVGGNVTYVTL